MGNRYGRPPLERFRKGEDGALEAVLESVVAPLFDLACHLFGSKQEARQAAASALAALAANLQTGRYEGDSPLAGAAFSLLEKSTRIPDADDVIDVAWDDEAELADITRKLSLLDPIDWRLAAAAGALDLEGLEWIEALGVDPEQGACRAETVVAGLGLSMDDFRDLLDARAARHKLPLGLVEAALAAALGPPAGAHEQQPPETG